MQTPSKMERSTALGRRAALTLPGLLLLPSRPARAATLEIAPVIVELPSARPAAALNIINSGSAPARLQLRAFSWVQGDGRDQLLPTDALLTSPPQFTLAPRQSQLARVALRQPQAGATEGAYRLLLDELPPVDGGVGVNMLIRVSLPVFAPPAQGLQSAPEYEVAAGSRPVLVIRNRGARRTILTDLRLGGMELRTDGPGYVLARSERRWTLPQAAQARAGGTLRLTGMRDGEALDVAVPVRAG